MTEGEEAKIVRDEAYHLFKAMAERHAQAAVMAGLVAAVGDFCDGIDPRFSKLFAADLVGFKSPLKRKRSGLLLPSGMH